MIGIDDIIMDDLDDIVGEETTSLDVESDSSREE